jgi:hypothetical protein
MNQYAGPRTNGPRDLSIPPFDLGKKIILRILRKKMRF